MYNLNRAIQLMIVFMAGAGLLNGCSGRSDDTPLTQAPTARNTSIAPDFTLKDISGREISLSQYYGKEDVLLVFGATWCPHCLHEIPELKDIYAQYEGNGVKLLYIDVQESREKVASFAQKNSIEYPVLLDVSGAVAQLYNVRGIPHQVLISKEGKVLYEGPRPRKGLLSLIKKILEI